MDGAGDGDAAAAADELGGEIVAGDEDQDHEGAGEKSRAGEREDDAAEGLGTGGTEVEGGLDQAVVQRLAGGPQGQDHERQVVVGEDEDGGEGAEEERPDRLVDEAQPLEQRVEHTFGAQHDAPGEDADEIARVERDQERREQGRLQQTHPLGDEEGERVGDHGRDERDAGTVGQGLEDEEAVGLAADGLGIIGERELAEHHGEVDLPEAVEQHQAERDGAEHEDIEPDRQGHEDGGAAAVHQAASASEPASDDAQGRGGQEQLQGLADRRRRQLGAAGAEKNGAGFDLDHPAAADERAMPDDAVDGVRRTGRDGEQHLLGTDAQGGSRAGGSVQGLQWQ